MIETRFLTETTAHFDRISKHQELKGVQKYGKPLNPLECLGDHDWLNMAEEELVDGFKYLQVEKEKKAVIKARLDYLVHYLTKTKESAYQEIIYKQQLEKVIKIVGEIKEIL